MDDITSKIHPSLLYPLYLLLCVKLLFYLPSIYHNSQYFYRFDPITLSLNDHRWNLIHQSSLERLHHCSSIIVSLVLLGWFVSSCVGSRKTRYPSKLLTFSTEQYKILVFFFDLDDLPSSVSSLLSLFESFRPPRSSATRNNRILLNLKKGHTTLWYDVILDVKFYYG